MLRGRSKPFVAAVSLLMLLGLVLSMSPATFAQGGVRGGSVPDRIADAKLDKPVTTALKLNQDLIGLSGRQQVIVRLTEKHAGGYAELGRAKQIEQGDKVEDQHDVVINLARSLDPSVVVLGQTKIVLNAVMLEIDAAALSALAANVNVSVVNPVVDFSLDLSETVPYIGATPDVQEAGNNGEGVKVAVLDSGIDYTHIAFGGEGTLDAYEEAYGSSPDDSRNTETDGLFPTARVVGGYDFVGEDWTGGAGSPPLAPDPDPIDFEGHGTHVADIIGGAQGVAPEVDLYAVKVCAAQSSSCSGVALLQGVEYSVDPNGDGDTSDHLDIMNMSLGSSYGQNYDDDLSLAVDNATDIGVLTVASAGNSSDKPYISGTPAATRSALSVAQTSVPTEVLPLMEVVEPAAIAGLYPAVFQPWSAPLTEVIEAPLQYGNGNGGNLLGCDPFDVSLEGKIVLVDRGACSFSIKIDNIDNAGGVAGIIGLVAPGDPFTGGFGGGDPQIPGFMISQANSNLLKSGLDEGVVVRFDPANGVPLVGTMVGSSSRGPSIGQRNEYQYLDYGQLIKPEIGAPGASISAVAGSGDGTEAFGGTSGAAPMVSGAAALLINETSDWGFSPDEIKSRLMNTAETQIYNAPPELGGDLAAITRIGNGEVRVDRAIAASAAAWEILYHSGSLSYGFVDVFQKKVTLRRTVVVQNYSGKAINYEVVPTFRFNDDVDNGAVTVDAPSKVRVGPYADRKFSVKVTIDGAKLREWALNSGAEGSNGDLLTVFEYDGYLQMYDRSNSDNNLHMAWHVLPRLAGNVSGKHRVNVEDGVGTLTLRNRGVGPAYVDAYSLIGRNLEPQPDGERGAQDPQITLKYVGVQTFPVDPGFCSADASFVMEFAVNTYERTTHANYPAAFYFYLDTNQDGTDDYVVYNDEIGDFASDGRNVTYAAPLDADGNLAAAATAFFFTGHSMNSANTVLTVCGEQIGLNAANFGQLMNIDGYSIDNYFTGEIMSSIEDMVAAPLGERYFAVTEDIPPGGKADQTVIDFGEDGTNPDELGLLFLFTGQRGDVRSGAPIDNEARVVYVR